MLASKGAIGERLESIEGSLAREGNAHRGAGSSPRPANSMGIGRRGGGRDRFLVARLGEVRSEEREGGACRFAANPKISVSTGMLKPGISSGQPPEERCSVGGHSRLEATGLAALNVR